MRMVASESKSKINHFKIVSLTDRGAWDTIPSAWWYREKIAPTWNWSRQGLWFMLSNWVLCLVGKKTSKTVNVFLPWAPLWQLKSFVIVVRMEECQQLINWAHHTILFKKKNTVIFLFLGGELILRDIKARLVRVINKFHPINFLKRAEIYCICRCLHGPGWG